MLPKFPVFKKLELSDQIDIEKITSKYQPYSDFDFFSMWSWDVLGTYRISELNGNLVVVLLDHFTNDPVYSFIGNNQSEKTIKQLFAFFEIIDNPTPVMKLIPEISLQDVNFKKYLIEIDLNNYDYVYSTMELSTYEGSKFSGKRKLSNRFFKNHNNVELKLHDLKSDFVKSEIINFSKYWKSQKTTEVDGLDLQKELTAIQRFLDANFEESFCTLLYADQKMVGYQLFTPSTHGYAICHFGKSDVNFNGAFEYMMSESCKLLVNKNIQFLNTEEDLGIQQLRFTKNSYHPITLLRKYTIKTL